MIKAMLDGKVDSLHFDEAWLPHAAFHPFYKNMHAVGEDQPRPKKSLLFSTQSTHKLLAGLSQASQVLVQDAEERKLDRESFNEAYLMHTSTSPQYAIIASCDVSAAMMESPGGTTLVEESIAEAMDFRRAMREVDAKFGADWWFQVWGQSECPDHCPPGHPHGAPSQRRAHYRRYGAPPRSGSQRGLLAVLWMASW
jgi:arginine decarboxylase